MSDCLVCGSHVDPMGPHVESRNGFAHKPCWSSGRPGALNYPGPPDYATTEESIAEVTRQRDALRDALRDVVVSCEALKADNVCDACAGAGEPFPGKPCMCRGSGKMSNAAVYLREQLVAVTASRDAMAELLRNACDPYSREVQSQMHPVDYGRQQEWVRKRRAALSALDSKAGGK